MSRILAKGWNILRPPPRLSVSNWADQFRFLSPEASAEAGKWQNRRAPHTVMPMDCLSPSDPCQQVVLKWSSQSAKSETLLNFIGYIIDQDPGPTLVVQPNSKPMAETFSKDRVAPMIRDTPTIKKKVSESKGRDSKNTMMTKAFEGGHVTLAGANSPAQLASRPIRYLLCDEVDRWEATKEGDPLKLAIKRTLTFWNRKILMVSSPTLDDRGIDAEYQKSLQHEWHLECQHCGEHQMPKFKHFLFDKDDHGEACNIRYVCEECGAEHTAKDEFKIKGSGNWVCVNEASDRIKGFWFNQFGSPFATWQETIQEFLDSKSDTTKLQAVVNTAFAETWQGTGEKLDWEVIRQRREIYPITEEGDIAIPEHASLVLMLVDTQDSWLDIEIVACNESMQSWGVENIQIHGNTEEPEVWAKLDKIRERQYRHESGNQLPIYAMAIDIKGHRTKVVKDYVYKRRFNNVFAFQGVGSAAKQMISRSKQQIESKNPRKVDVWSLRVDDLKRQVQGYLAKTDTNDYGYSHFPMLDGGQDVNGYDQEYFEQLCSEKQERKKTRGFERVEFVKTRTRNEAFDKRVYWRALVQILNPDWEAFRAKTKPKTEETIQPRQSGLFRGRTHTSSDPYL